jgi:hypothetical protein
MEPKIQRRALVGWTFFGPGAASRRDRTIVAWHEVPGKLFPRDPSRRVRCDRRDRDRLMADARMHPPIRYSRLPFLISPFYETIIICVGISEEARSRLRRKIPLGLANQSRRTLWDGSLGDTFSRHFVSGYDRFSPYGTACSLEKCPNEFST